VGLVGVKWNWQNNINENHCWQGRSKMQIGGESKKNYDNNIFKKEFEVVGNHTL
jgi:hypothetical protein